MTWDRTYRICPRYRLLAVMLVTLSVFAGGAVRAQIGPYSVVVDGVADSKLRDDVRSVSQLEEETKSPSATIRALRLRVDDGVQRVEKLLRSRGFYASKTTYDVNQDDPAKTVVTLHVEQGPPYYLRAYDIASTTPGEPRNPIDVPFEKLGIDVGQPVQAEQIISADGKLLVSLARQSYPLASIVDRKTIVDHDTRTVRVSMSVAMGPFVRFGETTVEGLSDVDAEVVARTQTWKKGEPFDASKLEEARSSLRETGLFSSVLIRHAPAVDAAGELPVTIEVVERKHRSIGAGGSFSTTEGLLATAFWTHRNIFGGGENLRIDAEVGEIRQGIFGSLRIPAFIVDNQDFVIDARLSQENPDGFDSLESAVIGRVERHFGSDYVGSAGGGFEHSRVDENGVEEDFTFLVLPLSLRHDTSDDLLDPSRGRRDTLTFTPNIGIVDTDANFFSARLLDTIYLPLADEKKLVLAGWLRLGTIVGEDTPDVPANKRLYAGGPGSVRGYSLNSIGPLDSQNDPIGGRSLTEFGVELRWRAFETIGFVGFVEAGGVYDDNVPEFGKDLQWGSGVGLRYLTAVGPIRFDVAMPINRRNDVDDAFQILVSLGQAF
jgi:translocation and assembly module TamA